MVLDQTEKWGQMSESRGVAHLVRTMVNVNSNGPTEPDEEKVLEELYGPPDNDGIYRGEVQE